MENSQGLNTSMGGMSQTSNRSAASSLPNQITNYLEKHQINRIVNTSVNKVLRQRPADPLSSIASNLITEAQNSVPVFDKILAKKVCLQELPNVHSIKVQVWLNYQGRSEMRYEHILTYDQDEHEKTFLYDNKQERVGVDQAIALINNDVNRVLKGIVIGDFSKIDNALSQYFTTKQSKEEEIGTNVIKVVSEALILATASCYDR